jgi:hypothetical protein
MERFKRLLKHLGLTLVGWFFGPPCLSRFGGSNPTPRVNYSQEDPAQAQARLALESETLKKKAFDQTLSNQRAGRDGSILSGIRSPSSTGQTITGTSILG